MKTADLTGAALDWAVAVCEGIEFEVLNQQVYIPDEDGVDEPYLYRPSNCYDDGGPIIERESIEVRYRVGVNLTATIDGQHAQTAAYRERLNPILTAAMRCYVASKLGTEVNIPSELTQGETK